MNLIELEKQVSKEMKKADDQLYFAMHRYNACKASINVAEFIKDIWNDAGFGTDDLEFRDYMETSGSFTVFDPALSPLEDEDIGKIDKALQDAVASSGLSAFIKVTTRRPRFKYKELEVRIEASAEPDAVEKQYAFWKDMEKRGAKELGI